MTNMAEIRAGFSVKRFHTAHRLNVDTVGHHTACVLAIIRRLYGFTPQAELLLAALDHDVPEHYTGDLPATVKWNHTELKFAMQSAEEACKERMGLEKYDLSDYQILVLKIADTLELVLSSVEEAKLGNRYARSVVKRGWEHVKMLCRSHPGMLKTCSSIVEEVEYYNG